MSNDNVKRYFLTAGSDSKMLQHSEGAFVRAFDHDSKIAELLEQSLIDKLNISSELNSLLDSRNVKITELQTKIEQIKNALNDHALSSTKCLEVIRGVIEKK